MSNKRSCRKFQLELKRVHDNPNRIRHIKQTNKLCLIAVQGNGFALKYVQNQTPEICLAAVKQYGMALHFVFKINLQRSV